MTGYPSFSHLIASDPELFIFRGFKSLSSRNLLHLQSALLEIDTELEELDKEEADRAQTDLDAQMSIQCWEVLSARAKDGDARESLKMDLVRRLQEATKEYQVALIRQNQVMKLPAPDERVFRVFKSWFESEQPFIGDGSKLLKQQQEHGQDFIALSPTSTDSDFLTRSLQNFVGWYSSGMCHETTTQIEYYSARSVSRLVTIITVLAASLVIEAAVVILFLMKNEALRLVMIAAFTSIFAASLAVMSLDAGSFLILGKRTCFCSDRPAQQHICPDYTPIVLGNISRVLVFLFHLLSTPVT
ncbi:hypothetical protein CDEST_01387 [Colletotrichum destructivum]|uniref:DUF6594 domain-containing protein n=1 Tax=Colletotrichum destructivum TaxID=34406 RepID=A0AAX4I037_9PEZI|nr:hypothetical protein CDEST_01387 [Colletotrichum destructivum]